MPKISVSLPDDIIEFIDKQGKNRSKTIVTILDEFKKNKQSEELAKAYEEYAQFCREEPGECEQTAIKDTGED